MANDAEGQYRVLDASSWATRRRSVRSDRTIANRRAFEAGATCAPPDERIVPARYGGHKLKQGDVVRVETGGGGGYGDVSQRQREAMLADVRNGYVSAEAAEQDYGVKLESGG